MDFQRRIAQPRFADDDRGWKLAADAADADAAHVVLHGAVRLVRPDQQAMSRFGSGVVCPQDNVYGTAPAPAGWDRDRRPIEDEDKMVSVVADGDGLARHNRTPGRRDRAGLVAGQDDPRRDRGRVVIRLAVEPLPLFSCSSAFVRSVVTSSSTEIPPAGLLDAGPAVRYRNPGPRARDMTTCPGPAMSSTGTCSARSATPFPVQATRIMLLLAGVPRIGPHESLSARRPSP